MTSAAINNKSVPTTTTTTTTNTTAASTANSRQSSAPSSKPATPSISEQPVKLSYASAAGRGKSSGTNTPSTPQEPATPVTTTTPSLPPPPPAQTASPSVPSTSSSSSTLASQSNASMNPSFPNGTTPTTTTSGPPPNAPTGPAATINGAPATPHHHHHHPPSASHSRTSSFASARPTPPPQPHAAKPSIGSQPFFPAQSPRMSMNNGGRSSPFPDYHDENRSPQSRNGSMTGVSMARHNSTSSQSDRTVPPSPRPNTRPNIAGYGYAYPPSQGYQYPQGMGRGGFRNPSATQPFTPGMPQQYRGQPPRSPHNQTIPMAPQMQQMYGLQPHMQPMPAPGSYYLPPEQYQMQGYMPMVQGFPQQPPPQPQFQPTAPPQMYPHQPQYPPPQQHQSTPARPSVSTPNLTDRTTPSPAPPSSTSTPSQAKEDTPAFIIPQKKGSSAIRIVNPDTKEAITFPKISVKFPERTPSPAKTVKVPKTHSPAPSVEIDRPGSAMKSKEEIAEEMKLKVQRKLEEERKAKEEAERIEREKKEEEERREIERIAEEERVRLEKEEAERKAEEERKAKEEEERIAREKAEAEAAEAARLAKEREEAEAKAKEEAEAKAKEEAEAKAKEAEAAVATPTEERRPSLGGLRKMAPPPLTIKADETADGQQSAALKTASFIKHDNYLSTKYPNGVSSPDPAINTKFGPKGFHYNVEFLYQFKDIYKDKPSEDWDVKIKETMGDLENKQPRPGGGPGRAVSTGGFASMGNFQKSASITRPHPGIPSITTPGGMPFGGIGSNFLPRPPPRSMSTSGQMQAPASPGGRTQSKSARQSSRRAPPPPPPPPEPPVEPLIINPNRWKPNRQQEPLGPLPGNELNKLSPEVVQRKVKSLLNKLTLEKFDKITDQILEIASQSKQETDGRTLRQIIQLTFEKATDEPNFSEMYALFCRKIMETIDPNITDPTVLNKDGQPLTGGQLFRKYLLNRCQEEFERGWKVNLPPKPDENASGKEAELLSEAYYAAAKAKRQGLGLVQFIGELFKLNMLIEKIMYECIIRLLGGTDDPRPEPEEVESLCKLLTTVGKQLDEGKAKTRMNAIYEALDHMRVHSDLESRIKFKILDILDIRKNGWVPRGPGQTGPKTIQEIHEDAAKAKAEADLARQSGRSRSEMGRGDVRMDGYHSLPRPKMENRAGDLSKLGMVRQGSGGGLGPQMSQFSSMRSQSRKGGISAGSTLTREGSSHSSRTATPGVATPPSVHSTNSFDIFRNEAEVKEEETPLRTEPEKAAAPDDEVAEGGYFTIPPIQSVASTTSVPNFVIARKGHGKIAFKEPVDLTDISGLSTLREIVEIDRTGRVSVYKDKKNAPPVGKGLNVPAIVTLENHNVPPDFEKEEFIQELQAKDDSTFISYDADKGVYVYEVQHF